MTPGIGFALSAMLCFGAGDVIYKRAAALRIDASQFVMLQAWVFCPAITIYAWLTGTLEPNLGSLWGALAGLFSLVGFTNFAASLRDGAVSTNAPIFRLNFTLTAVLAILLLGETLTVSKAVALVLALAAVWLLLAEPGAARGNTTLRSLARVLVATVAMGFANLFYKLGLKAGALPETMVTMQAWAFCPAATLFVFLPKLRFDLTPGAWRPATLAAIALLVGFVLMMHGLLLGAASTLVPVAQMGFVFTALIGVALFGERLDARKSFGLLVAAGALALFSFG
jgi:drug/metabolite transporter (DMT)-like permease